MSEHRRHFEIEENRRAIFDRDGHEDKNIILYNDGETIIMQLSSKKHGDKLFIIDAGDYLKIKQYKWCVAKNGHSGYFYANAYGKRTNGRRNVKKLHRIIMGAEDKQLHVDHINHNTQDNRKCNLRICSNTENHWNTKIIKSNKSGYRGVSFRSDIKKYTSRISVNNKYICLGCFNSKEEAAIAYNNAAIIYHGEFANLNNVVQP